MTVWGNVVDLQRYNIAATKFTIDGHIEQGQVTEPTFDLELCSDRPDVLGTKWRLCTDDLSLFHGTFFEALSIVAKTSVMTTSR